MKTPEEKRWERVQQLLLAESRGDAPVRMSSGRTLFDIKSHVEEVIERTVEEENARLKAERKGNATLEVRRAKPNETLAVQEFYHEMIDAMKGSDFDVLWARDEHPTDDFLEDAIVEERQFIGLLNDEIVCGLAVDQDPAPGFEKIEWLIDAPVKDTWIVHIVATSPDHHGKGYAADLMNGLIEEARCAGIKSLRLDTFEHNKRARRLYEKVGFVDLGAHPVWYQYLGTIYPHLYEYVVE